MPEELVILVDHDGRDIGSAPKASVHTHDTPLHRAFSCYIFDDGGNVLLTRRALSKKTWPGVWTNSLCGHPAPGESNVDAIHRRMREELGGTLSDVEVVLPDFAYQAIDASGVMENEVCPVHTARLVGPLQPHPDEVEEWSWVRPEGLLAALHGTPDVFSPWLQLQVPLLAANGVLVGDRPGGRS